MIDKILKIFEELNNSGVEYIHWKSNEHLEASLNGDTDFDILVSYNDLKQFVNIIESNGFTLFESVGSQNYNGVFDYLYVSDLSFTVLHFHLHAALITGAKFVKEYRLPVEQLVLNDRILDDTGNVYVIDPSKELALLWLRFFSKTSALRFIQKRGRIGNGFIIESNWLKERCKRESMLSFLQSIFKNNNKIACDLCEYPFGEQGFLITLEMIRRTRKELKLYKTERFVSEKYWAIRIGMILRYVVQKYLHYPIPYRRIQLSGGKIIAFVGCDGAGKSAIIKHLLKTLRKKIDVYDEYFGSGEGHCYWYRYPFWVMHRIMQKKNAAGKTAINNAVSEEKNSIAKVIWAVLLAMEKKSKLNRINSARAKGMLVLCDRYPQTQFMGINDGPLLYRWLHSSSAFQRRIANWEIQIYEKAKIIQPDITLKLMITEEVSVQRKPEERTERIREKIRLMESLEIPSHKNRAIDATASFEEVLQNVYMYISELISGK